MIYEKLPTWITKWLEPERRIWPVFAAVFLSTQLINIWALFPDYSGWNVFGFPFTYIRSHPDLEYFYFDAVFLAINIVIMFVASKLLVFGYHQLTKYKIVK